MALTKVTQTVIATGAISSSQIANGSITADHLTGVNTDHVSEGSTNVYFSNARARSSLSGSTGVTYDSSTGAISIGQAVGTSDSVAFGQVTVDDITINGSTISSASSMVLDVVGNLTVNVDGTTITLADDTINFGQFYNNASGQFNIYAPTQDKDIVFLGNDGGSTITALTLDMSSQGDAIFNNDIILGDGNPIRFGDDQDLRMWFDGNHGIIQNTTSNSDIYIKGNDGGSTITMLNFDTSNLGKATFSGDILTPGSIAGTTDASQIQLGSGNRAQIFHNSAGLYMRTSTGPVYAQADSFRHIASDASTDYLVSTSAALTVSTGVIRGPSTLTIDPAAHGNNTGTVVIAGDLQVDGTTTTINSTTVNIDDLNIQLATGAANAAAANGAGITVDGASATITYDGTNDEWDFNKDINVTGAVVSSANGAITTANGTTARFSVNETGGAITAMDARGSTGNIGTRSNHTLGFLVNDIQKATLTAGGDFTVTNDIKVTTTNPRIDYDGGNSGALRFYSTSAAQERMRITSGGNVGIGTNGPVTSLSFGEASTGITFLSTATNFNSGKVAGIRGEVGGTGYGNLAFDTFQGGNGGGERMIIRYDGNVGIGTTDPSYKLQVTGSLGLTNGGGLYLLPTDASDTDAWILYQYTDNTLRYNFTGAGSDEIIVTGPGSTNATTLYVDTENKKVGVGTASISTANNVALTIGDTSFPYTGLSITAGTNSEEWRLYSSFNSNNDAIFGIYSVADNNYKLIIHENGNVGIGTSSPVANLVVRDIADGTHNGGRIGFGIHEAGSLQMYHSTNMSRTAGGTVTDSTSSGGDNVTLSSGQLYGPYINLPRGQYRLCVKMKTTDASYTGDAARITVYGPSSSVVTENRIIKGTDFDSNNKWETFSVPFQVVATGTSIEYYAFALNSQQISIDYLFVMNDIDSYSTRIYGNQVIDGNSLIGDATAVTSPVFGAQQQIVKNFTHGQYGVGRNGNLYLLNTNTNGEAGFLCFGGYSNHTNNLYYQTGGIGGGTEAQDGGSWGGYLNFWTTSDGTAGAASGMFEHMRINADGNVGIGVINPNNKLEVDGHIGLSKNGTDGNRWILIEGADATYAGTLNIQAGFGSTSAGGAIKLYAHSHATYPGSVWIGRSAGASGNIMFGNGGTGPTSSSQIQMVINSSGNVGIGLDAPYFPLHVQGPTGVNGEAKNNILAFDTTSATTGTGGGIAFGGYSNGTGGDIYHFGNIQGIKENGTAGNYASAMLFSTRANGATPTEKMRIASNGDMIYGGSTGVHEKTFEGTAQGLSTFSHDIVHTSDAGVGTILHIQAAFTHHPSYDCILDTWVSRRQSTFSHAELFRRDTSLSGSWTVSYVSNTVTRITKNAGTYVGGGPYWIKATWKNYD
jgi:hypothetical protein